MRGLWIVFAFAPQAAGADRWFAADKIQHFVASAFVEGLSYSSLRAAGVTHGSAMLTASVVTLGVGVGKEAHDRHTESDFSARDLAWDIAGGATMAVLLNQTRR